MIEKFSLGLLPLLKILACIYSSRSTQMKSTQEGRMPRSMHRINKILVALKDFFKDFQQTPTLFIIRESHPQRKPPQRIKLLHIQCKRCTIIIHIKFSSFSRIKISSLGLLNTQWHLSTLLLFLWHVIT